MALPHWPQCQDRQQVLLKVLTNVRFWRKADIGPTGVEELLLTQSGHWRGNASPARQMIASPPGLLQPGIGQDRAQTVSCAM
jgi:hypothetical protein